MILGEEEGRPAFTVVFEGKRTCEHAVRNAKKWMLEGREEKTPKCTK